MMCDESVIRLLTARFPGVVRLVRVPLQPRPHLARAFLKRECLNILE